MFLSTFLGESGNIFFPKLDFHKDQIYFKDIALDFLKSNDLDPEILFSEREAKSFDIKANKGKYPIYFFKTDTSGEKSYEEFYTENENYNLNKFKNLGFIKTTPEKISFDNVLDDFNNVFLDSESSKLDIIKIIKKYVNNFSHIETGKHLDQKM